MPYSSQKSMKKTGSSSQKRVLFVATVDFHFKKFHLPTLKWFQDQGWEVHVAAYGNMKLPYVDVQHSILVDRSPFRTKNFKGYQQLKAIIDKFQFKLIHCHTPMGGVLTRLAARKARIRGTKVLYTAHGFHFCKGAPKKNWLIYYPIEKMLARFTDALITINEEDYRLANDKKFKAGQILKVNGVGVDTSFFKPVSEKEKRFLRTSFGFQPEVVLLFYAAEFNENKNQQLLIRALGQIKESGPNANLLLAGSGNLMDLCQKISRELGIEERVHFLGYQENVLPYLQLSDIAVASSLREGLPVNIMEAMACELPIVASDNRGHRELVVDRKNGYLINPQDEQQFSLKLLDLIQFKTLREKMGTENKKLITKYSSDQIQMELAAIYSSFILEKEQVKEWAYQ
jgi:glycosyltransferase EpsD